MPLSLKDVEHIAMLARLELTADQKQRYLGQLSAILEYIAKLQELDTSQVPPTAGGGSIQHMPLRLDEARPGLTTAELLSNAPQKEDDQFRIPPVFE